jgi:hypothetical protein
VRTIQSDLEAYFQRKPDNKYKHILDDMKKTEVVRALARDGEKVSTNLSGQAMIGSEFWADTLDRWAEELVAAGKAAQSGKSDGQRDSLPPEIILKAMQALQKELKLRDETRELETAKAAIPGEKYKADASGLGDKQENATALVRGATSDIQAIPGAEKKFGKELKLLTEVRRVMEEAQDTLETPDTGPKAVAAETEAIELLLQSNRQNPNGGGGSGGSNPGGGGTAAGAMSSALNELGPGANAESVITARPVGQATGRAGREFPDEFKAGLESYFNLLEGGPARK